MYYDLTVKIPDVPGKIIRKKKGSVTYILFEYGRTYKSDKRYCIPKRAIIGKLAGSDPDLMQPNEQFEVYFPDSALPEELPEAYRSSCLRIGSHIVIRKVLEEYGLPGLLEKEFGEKHKLAMDLIAYLIVSEENVGQHYPDFAYDHPLFSEGMRIYSDSTVSRFLSSISLPQMQGFLNDWNKKRDKTQRIYLSYDSTNKNCEAGDIDLVEYGKPKDDLGYPIFNVSVAYDSTNRVPLFYEEYPGSITDVSQLPYVVDKVKDYGYENVGFILDRGYFSKDNITYMDQNGCAFLIMIKGRRSLVSSLVSSVRGTFETDRKCSIRSYKVYGTTVKAPLYEDDTKERYIHIYFNPGKCGSERESVEERIEKLRKHIESREGKIATLGRPYTDYFDIHYSRKGELLYATERSDVVQAELERCGYFCIASSEEMTASEALIRYKGRDVSEKLFQADKTFIGSGSMRSHSEENLSARIFIEFIALIVRNRIYNLLKETMLRLEARPNYMTVPAALRELEKIEIVKGAKDIYRMPYAVTKKQKIILSSFGLDADSVKASAKEMSDLLAKNGTISDNQEQEEDDGTYEDSCFD